MAARRRAEDLHVEGLVRCIWNTYLPPLHDPRREIPHLYCVIIPVSRAPAYLCG